MFKAAFFFPGIGYGQDRPLLYYSKKLAASAGYSINEISYSGFPKGILGNAERMREAFESAMGQAWQSFQKLETPKESDILFVSKSIGTAVAAAIQQKHGIDAKNIYFTPLAETFSFAGRENGIVFHGTGDPWAETGDIEEGCSRLSLPLFTADGADHSLETGNTDKDLAIMRAAMSICSLYILEGGGLALGKHEIELAGF